MDARCHIELFGALRVTQGIAVHTHFRSHKAAALLSYLALSLSQAHSREHLIERFWPEREIAAGRNNLSTTLSQLRRQLEPTGVPARSVLVADHQQVRLNADSVSTDLAEFDRLILQAKRAPEPTARLPLLQRIVALYRGDLLSGSYEDWALGEQNRCRMAYLEALALLTETLEGCGDMPGALATAQKRIEADPYEESAYRAQMRLHLLQDHPAKALETYRHLEKLFRKELGAQPAPEIRAFAEQIQNDPRARLSAHPKPRLSAPASPPVAVAPAELIASPVSEQVPPPLPLQLSRLFGRHEEREALCRRLLDPDIRLVTLLGTGGVGKTRLSVVVAEQLLPAFSGRGWFVPLAEVPDPGFLPYALLNALKLPPAVITSDPLERVVEALGTAPCLLVLDNFEHLLREKPEPGKSDQQFAGSGPALVRLLLARAPGLKILTTSRQALRLAGEQEFALSPLSVPPTGVYSAVELLENASVALFTDRARAVKPDFNLSDSNSEAVAHLCRILEGVPLSLEIAAAWTRTLSPQGLVERLDHQLTLLVSRQRDLPLRHRSLRATIEWSYDLLSPELRDFFALLGVFRGGWTLEAAETICGRDTLAALEELQEHSLVLMEEREGDVRYRLQEPLREFAQERLQATQQLEATRRTHAAYFLTFALEAEQQLVGADQLQWISRLEADHDNLRAALEEGEKETRLHIAAALWQFWDVRGYYSEGRMRLKAALEATETEASPRARELALNAAGVLALRQGDYAFARRMHEECLTLSRKSGSKADLANSLGNLGILAYDQGDYASARRLQEECLMVVREMEHKGGIASTLHNLSNVAREQGDYALVRSCIEESLAINRELGNIGGISAALHGLGNLAINQGEDDAARKWHTESLTIMRKLGDRGNILSSLSVFATLAIREENAARAVRLWSAVSSLREVLGSPLPPNLREEREAEMVATRKAMGDARFHIAWQEGRAITLEQAIAYALREADLPPSER